MRTPELTTLPVPLPYYDAANESVQRKASEQYLQDLRADILDGRKKTARDESLSLRRFQFLLMGAS